MIAGICSSMFCVITVMTTAARSNNSNKLAISLNNNPVNIYFKWKHSSYIEKDGKEIPLHRTGQLNPITMFVFFLSYSLCPTISVSSSTMRSIRTDLENPMRDQNSDFVQIWWVNE
jgi:hypothetical protein